MSGEDEALISSQVFMEVGKRKNRILLEAFLKVKRFLLHFYWRLSVQWRATPFRFLQDVLEGVLLTVKSWLEISIPSAVDDSWRQLEPVRRLGRLKRLVILFWILNRILLGGYGSILLYGGIRFRYMLWHWENIGSVIFISHTLLSFCIDSSSQRNRDNSTLWNPTNIAYSSISSFIFWVFQNIKCRFFCNWKQLCNIQDFRIIWKIFLETEGS